MINFLNRLKTTFSHNWELMKIFNLIEKVKSKSPVVTLRYDNGEAINAMTLI